MDSKPTAAPIRKIAEKPFAGIDDYKRTTNKFVNIDERIPDGVPLQARWKHAESKNEFIGTPHPFDDFSPEAPLDESQPTCFGKCCAHPDQIVGSAQEVRVCVASCADLAVCC